MLRQFRVDDDLPWALKYCSGIAGQATYNSTHTLGSADGANWGTFTGTQGNTTGNITNFATQTFNFPCVIHQTTGSGATNNPNWEFNYLVSVSGGTATFLFPLALSYNGGAQIFTSSEFLTVDFQSSAVISPLSWNGSYGGFGLIFANQAVTIEGQLNAIGQAGASVPLDTSGQGGAGAGFKGGNASLARDNGQGSQGFQGDSYAGTGVKSSSPNGNAGGGGTHNNSASGGAGSGAGAGAFQAGGVGVSGPQGGPGSGGNSIGVADLKMIILPAGGGGGGGGFNYISDQAGAGGSGAGVWIIVSPVITVTGSILGTGGNGGYYNTNSDGSAAGGGAGADFLFKGQQINLGSNLVTALGGAGGHNSSGVSRDGGAGSMGWIHIDYLLTPTQTTNPVADIRFDPILASSSPLIALF